VLQDHGRRRVDVYKGGQVVQQVLRIVSKVHANMDKVNLFMYQHHPPAAWLSATLRKSSAKYLESCRDFLRFTAKNVSCRGQGGADR
jgi:hypothetical protein